MARRDDREYREYLSEEQRRHAGCIAGRMQADLHHGLLGGTVDVEGHSDGKGEMGPRWIFLIAFALVFYGNGAGFIESFVNYSSWHLIGKGEFVAYHQFISPRVLTFLVAPAFLGTVFTILMLWSRPAAIPVWAVWAAIAAQTVVWISTATIQVPIQLQLSEHGLSVELIERLIETNFWLRRIPYAVCAGLFLWMAAQVMGTSGERLSITEHGHS